MGFICLSPILAARVLGPAAGVRITFGTKTCEEAKHAAVMGADVRPCPVREILVDQKNRVVSTPAYMYDDARLSDVGFSIERLVRQVVSLARDRQQRPQPGRASRGDRVRANLETRGSAGRDRSQGPHRQAGRAASWSGSRTCPPRPTRRGGGSS